MLDFYLIKDETSKQLHVTTETDYLGGIEFNEFEQLQDMKIIESNLDYFRDFRWTSQQVQAKLQLFSEKQDLKDFKLLPMLQKAMSLNCGMMAYAD